MDTRPSLTAEVVCFMRAVDQLNPPEQRVIDDPYARHFLSAPLRSLLKSPAVAWRTLPELTTYIRARHRYMDDQLRAALVREPIAQLVILGAGYDARGHRLADVLGDRPVFEVDYPTTAARKQATLHRVKDQPLNPAVRYVTIDFQTQSISDVLLASGFDPSKPTFFTWEGVSMYLSRAAVHGTLTALRGLAAPGSVLTMDYFRYLDHHSLTASAHRLSAGLLAFISEPVTFPMDPEDVPAFMAKDGWTVTDSADSPELERRYIRDGHTVYPANFVVTAHA